MDNGKENGSYHNIVGVHSSGHACKPRQVRLQSADFSCGSDEGGGVSRREPVQACVSYV